MKLGETIHKEVTDYLYHVWIACRATRKYLVGYSLTTSVMRKLNNKINSTIPRQHEIRKMD